MKINHLSENEWEKQISWLKHATPFHQTYWHRLLKSSWKDLKVEYFAVEKGSETICLIPVFKRRKFGLKLMGSPLRAMFTPYLGACNEKGPCAIQAAPLEALMKKLSPDFFEIACPTNCSLAVDGARQARTVLVDLKPEEEDLWKGMKKKTRGQVRKAQKTNVEILGPESNDEWIPEYYRILTKTYRRRDMVPPASISFYQEMWRQLHHQGLLKVLMARFEGKIIAGGIYLLWNDMIYGLDGATDRQYQKQCPNNLVEWETIAWGAAHGYKYYDMMGADIPSIAKFKVGFGGDVETYEKLELQPTLAGRLAFSFYDRFKTKIKKVMRV